MTDEELTNLAAKAFGDVPQGFSPLTDDGDALRLAVRLNLLDGAPEFHSRRALEVALMSDPYEATRRAIVRAAAAIGAKND